MKHRKNEWEREREMKRVRGKKKEWVREREMKQSFDLMKFVLHELCLQLIAWHNYSNLWSKFMSSIEKLTSTRHGILKARLPSSDFLFVFCSKTAERETVEKTFFVVSVLSLHNKITVNEKAFLVFYKIKPTKLSVHFSSHIRRDVNISRREK